MQNNSDIITIWRNAGGHYISKFTTNNKIRFSNSIRYLKILNFQYLTINRITLINHIYLYLIFMTCTLQRCSHEFQKAKMCISLLGTKVGIRNISFWLCE